MTNIFAPDFGKDVTHLDFMTELNRRFSIFQCLVDGICHSWTESSAILASKSFIETRDLVASIKQVYKAKVILCNYITSFPDLTDVDFFMTALDEMTSASVMVRSSWILLESLIRNSYCH
jgi:hypothetical protein